MTTIIMEEKNKEETSTMIIMVKMIPMRINILEIKDIIKSPNIEIINIMNMVGKINKTIVGKVVTEIIEEIWEAEGIKKKGAMKENTKGRKVLLKIQIKD